MSDCSADTASQQTVVPLLPRRLGAWKDEVRSSELKLWLSLRSIWGTCFLHSNWVATSWQGFGLQVVSHINPTHSFWFSNFSSKVSQSASKGQNFLLCLKALSCHSPIYLWPLNPHELGLCPTHGPNLLQSPFRCFTVSAALLTYVFISCDKCMSVFTCPQIHHHQDNSHRTCIECPPFSQSQTTTTQLSVTID